MTRYNEILRSFIDGAGSAASIAARMDRIVATVGEDLDPELSGTFKENAASRVESIEDTMPTPSSGCPEFTD